MGRFSFLSWLHDGLEGDQCSGNVDPMKAVKMGVLKESTRVILEARQISGIDRCDLEGPIRRGQAGLLSPEALPCRIL